MPERLTEGGMWSFLRSVMSQGVDIRMDYEQGTHAGYEAYSARLDAAAAERAQGLHAEFLAYAAAREAAERERVRGVLRRVIDAYDRHQDNLNDGLGIMSGRALRDEAEAARAELGERR